jgi:23S rRNA pseudouridine1911/1915/1917 synthase
LIKTAPNEGWLPAAFNGGHAYRDRVSAAYPSVVAFYAGRYTHSDRAVWSERLAAGEVWRNGQQLLADAPLAAGDRLVWHRPPWQEPAVPVLHKASVVFDDGDLLVLNKPSGLPVLPAGGFLDHTLLSQLNVWAPKARPVHRLGRFTSGLLVCARRSNTRAWLSAQLRDSTEARADSGSTRSCRKIYRALCAALPTDWAIGETRAITAPIGKRSHPLLGQIWCAAEIDDSAALPSRSEFTLMERWPTSCLVEVAIATGRPHQIRIHAAAIGAPLDGDPLYRPGGTADPHVLPGAGGYLLHAQYLRLVPPTGEPLCLEAAPPTRSGLKPAAGLDSSAQAFSKASRREK